MSFSPAQTGSRPLRLLLAALAALLAAVGLGLLAGSASGASAQLIGPKKSPKPVCPSPTRPSYPAYKACTAYGHVTGFQMSAAGQNGVYKVRRDGRIVAWSVATAKPRARDVKKGGETYAAERPVFEQKLPDDTFDRFGGNPTAGISILKPQGKGRFKLTKSSPILELNDALGETPIYTLQKPLRVKKGTIVALTTPTWVTNFGLSTPNGKSSLPRTYKWRGSRRPNRCDSEADLTTNSKPHVKKGTARKYGCVYKGAQILYWAYHVPDRKAGGRN
jgi:hypothetical protein